MTWCDRLAHGIVLQAVADYRASLRGRRASATMSVQTMKKDCEKFFLSEWFTILTKVDGELLMKKLQEEYENECNTRTKYRTAYRNNL